jgi:ABC-type transport system involved in multi-copper enzyme maturation permease subunit
MSSNSSAAFLDADLPPVGPFTGFGNFLRKEFRDWWNSWRLIIIFCVMTLLMTLMVFFAFSDFLKLKQFRLMEDGERPSDQLMATQFIMSFLDEPPFLVVQIFILIFSTMGLLTVEKSTGTLAWNLTKPVGRTGLLFAKWLAATTMLWVSMCALPIAVGMACMSAYQHLIPEFTLMAPIVCAALAWIGLWVLLTLTISLGFQSQAAVAGIVITFWAVPNILGMVMGAIVGNEAMEWIRDRLATNSPFWAYDLLADKQLSFWHKPHWKNIYLYAFTAWTVVLSVLSVRIFNRQEIGS